MLLSKYIIWFDLIGWTSFEQFNKNELMRNQKNVYHILRRYSRIENFEVESWKSHRTQIGLEMATVIAIFRIMDGACQAS